MDHYYEKDPGEKEARLKKIADEKEVAAQAAFEASRTYEAHARAASCGAQRPTTADGDRLTKEAILIKGEVERAEARRLWLEAEHRLSDEAPPTYKQREEARLKLIERLTEERTEDRRAPPINDGEARDRAHQDELRCYSSLRKVLDRAYQQAARGKGKERHANDDPFEQQFIVQMGLLLGGTTDGNVFQACKKAVESKRLPRARRVAELLGAINYLVGAVIIVESQPEEESK